MPRVDIGELILEVMGWHPQFTAAYTHVSGGGTRISDDLDITLAAVLTAQSLNVGWGPVVTPGVLFGLLKLLGVDYRPELADLPDQKLWRTNPSADYGPLDQAARGKIDLSRVKRRWPDIVRVVASVHSGQISASDTMRMLQRGGNPTQLGDALAHFGRIFKTLHVLTYVDRESYRRGI